MPFPYGMGPTPPTISTREEFLRLQRERAAPASQPDLTPDGPTMSTINVAAEQEKENRMLYLERRLHGASVFFRTEHQIVSQKDPPKKTEWDRER